MGGKDREIRGWSCCLQCIGCGLCILYAVTDDEDNEDTDR